MHVVARSCRSVLISCAVRRRPLATQSSSTATVARFKTHGKASDVISLEQEPLPAVSGRKLKLQMIAAPIHPADFNLIAGNYGENIPAPGVAGIEGVGIVTEVGPGVQLFKRGDWAIASGTEMFGTWRTHAVVSEEALLKVPNDIPTEYAACIAVNPLTALRLLKEFVPLRKGDVVIQNGGNSAVGQAVIQLAKLQGVRTISLIRKRPEGNQIVEKLKTLGGDLVVNEEFARGAEFRALLKELGRPQLALNCVGGESALFLSRTLRDGGTMVTFGGMGGSHGVLASTSSLIFKDIRLRGFWLARWSKTRSQAQRQEAIDELVKLVKQKNLSMWLERHAFSDVKHALARAEQPYKNYKVVMMMEK